MPKGSSISIKEPSIFLAMIFRFDIVLDDEADVDDAGGGESEEEEGNGAVVKEGEGEENPFEDEFEDIRVLDEDDAATDGFDDVKAGFDSVEPSICLPTPEKLRVDGAGEGAAEEKDECKLFGSDFSFLLLAASAKRFIFWLLSSICSHVPSSSGALLSPALTSSRASANSTDTSVSMMDTAGGGVKAITSGSCGIGAGLGCTSKTSNSYATPS